MKQHFLRLLILSLAVGASSSALAQSPSPYIFTARPKYTFSAGIKVRSGGGKVKFGQLGSLSRSLLSVDQRGLVTITYDDGFVTQDPGKRQAEVAESTVPYDLNGLPRYRVYSTSTDETTGVTTKTQVGDGVAYQDGMTREWGYTDASQVSGSFIDMHAVFAATSDGGSAQSESDGSGGFDLQLNRDIRAIGKKGMLGVAVSFGVNEINAKTHGTVTSSLHTIIDRYSLNGRTAPTRQDGTLPYAAPLFGDGLAEDGTALPTGNYEYTTPLSLNPVGDRIEVVTPGAAAIEGNWQLKSSYYMARIGPSFRYQFLRRFSLSGSAGVAAAYWGSVYQSDERIREPVVSDVFTHEEKRKSGVLVGYFGELNAEFWFTYQTGIFLGVVYEYLGNFSQTLAGRTADVEVGSGLALRVGIITRF